MRDLGETRKSETPPIENFFTLERESCNKNIESAQDATKLFKALAESTPKIRALVDQSPLPIIGLDNKGRIVYWSPMAAKLFGWTEEEVLGGLSPTVTPEYCSEALDMYNRLMRGEVISQLTTRRRHKSGRDLYISIFGFPVFDPEGGIAGLIVTCFDLTAQKNTEEALRQAQDAKNLFFASASHEIRTPIASIMAAVDNLDLEKNPELIHSFVQTVKTNGAHLLRLIDDMLTLENIQQPSFVLAKTSFSLSHLLSDTLKMMEPDFQKKHLTLDFAVHPTIPFSLVSDPIRVRQIVMNLLSNAIKFTPCGGRIGVDVRTSTDLNQIIIDIADTGVGVDHSCRSQIFMPFVRGNNARKDGYPGSGLGLAFSRSLARSLSGELELYRTAPNRGSIFRLSLPLDIPSTHETQSAPQSPHLRGVNHSQQNLLQGLNLLIVDDSQDIAFAYQTYLSRFGANVDRVSNGREAIDRIDNKNYHIVFMDIEMPILDGFETVKLLREKGDAVPIVAISSHCFPEQAERCKAAGFTDYISKPMSLRDFVGAIVEMKKKYEITTE